MTSISQFALKKITAQTPAGPLILATAVLLLAVAAFSSGPLAQDNWPPFRDNDDASPAGKSATAGSAQPKGSGTGYLRPMTGIPNPSTSNGSPSGYEQGAAQAARAYQTAPPPLSPNASTIERSELAPIEVPQSAATPPQDARSVSSLRPTPGGAIQPSNSGGRTQPGNPSTLDEKAVATLHADKLVPVRSAVLMDLWRRQLLLAPGASTSDRDLALRIESLWRAGLLEDATNLAKRIPDTSTALLLTLKARVFIAAGWAEQGCVHVRQATKTKDTLPKALRPQLLLQVGYCGVIRKKPKAAETIAGLIKEQGGSEADTAAILGATARGRAPNLGAVRKLTPLGIRLAMFAQAPITPSLVKASTPAAIALLATDKEFPADVAATAAVHAADFNFLPISGLAGAYQRPSGGNASPQSKQEMRQHYLAAVNSKSTFQKIRAIRSLLDAARRNRFYLPALKLSAPIVGPITPAQEIGWFSESAIEALLSAQNFQAARSWATFAGLADLRQTAAYGHWNALIDISDTASKPARGTDLTSIETMALQGRFSPEALHRLATVLDALNYNVPMRLWEAASRTRQPSGGHLPKTGVLKQLQDASRNREQARLAVLVIRTIGKKGPTGAHMIALGDAIRGLRRAGLHREARQLAFEALLPLWPRNANN